MNRVSSSGCVNSNLLKFLLLGIVVVASGPLAKAQVSASINGRVQDSSGAAVPDATVTVTSAETRPPFGPPPPMTRANIESFPCPWDAMK